MDSPLPFLSPIGSLKNLPAPTTSSFGDHTIVKQIIGESFSFLFFSFFPVDNYRVSFFWGEFHPLPFIVWLLIPSQALFVCRCCGLPVPTRRPATPLPFRQRYFLWVSFGSFFSYRLLFKVFFTTSAFFVVVLNPPEWFRGVGVLHVSLWRSWALRWEGHFWKGFN